MTDKLRIVNGVDYSVPTQMNLVQKRQLREAFAERQTYTDTSQEIQFRLTSSSDFIYGRNCYLVFDVSATLTGAVQPHGFPDGCTALNLFSRLLVEDQSGAELERIDDLNEWASSVLPYYWSGDYKKQAETAGAYNTATGEPASYAVNDGANPSSVRVVIPMWWISGIFNSHTLIPPTLSAGMLLRFTLDSPTRALCRLSGTADTITASTYTIENPRIITDSLTLAPQVQKAIMEKSQGGLPFMYKTLFRDQFAVQSGGSKTFNVQINKAVARGLAVDQIIRDNTATASLENVDTRGIPANVQQVQCRVGDLYVSNQPVRTGTSQADADVKKNSSELVNYTYWAMGKTDCFDKPPEVGLTQYRTAFASPGASAGANAGRSVICHNLEQSPHVKDSGLSINNSRVCELQISTSDGNTNAQTCKTWLHYVKLAMSYPSRAVVKE